MSKQCSNKIKKVGAKQKAVELTEQEELPTTDCIQLIGSTDNYLQKFRQQKTTKVE